MRAHIYLLVNGKRKRIPGYFTIDDSSIYRFHPSTWLDNKTLSAVNNFKRKRAMPKKNGHYANERTAF